MTASTPSGFGACRGCAIRSQIEGARGPRFELRCTILSAPAVRPVRANADRRGGNAVATHFWCIVAAWAVVYLTKLPIAAAMNREGGYTTVTRGPNRRS